MFCERSCQIEANDKTELIDYLYSSSIYQNKLQHILDEINHKVNMLASWGARIDPGDLGD
jgi:hypothetical protein